MYLLINCTFFQTNKQLKTYRDRSNLELNVTAHVVFAQLRIIYLESTIKVIQVIELLELQFVSFYFLHYYQIFSCV